MLTRRLFGKSIVASLMGWPLLVHAPQARAQERAFAHLSSALYEMRAAKEELKDERFKRHREQAIRDLDAAIGETEKAFREAKIELGRHEPPRNPKEYYKAYRDFPHLRHAVIELREAKKEMEREKRIRFGPALKAINVAILHVEEALKDSR